MQIWVGICAAKAKEEVVKDDHEDDTVDLGEEAAKPPIISALKPTLVQRTNATSKEEVKVAIVKQMTIFQF